MTAVLSWYVQKFVVLWWVWTELKQNEISMELNYEWKIVSEMGPRCILGFIN